MNNAGAGDRHGCRRLPSPRPPAAAAKAAGWLPINAMAVAHRHGVQPTESQSLLRHIDCLPTRPTRPPRSHQSQWRGGLEAQAEDAGAATSAAADDDVDASLGYEDHPVDDDDDDETTCGGWRGVGMRWESLETVEETEADDVKCDGMPRRHVSS
ncbi:hypothetical protein BKA81DRAFT_397 [Phyllosticta paracitricarpa]